MKIVTLFLFRNKDGVGAYATCDTKCALSCLPKVCVLRCGTSVAVLEGEGALEIWV